jgi:uncharacterized protein YbaR (Trm112 family)
MSFSGFLFGDRTVCPNCKKPMSVLSQISSPRGRGGFPCPNCKERLGFKRSYTIGELVALFVCIRFMPLPNVTPNFGPTWYGMVASGIISVLAFVFLMRAALTKPMLMIERPDGQQE